MDVLAQEIAALGARVVLKPFDLDRLLGVVGELLGAWASSAPPMACTDQRARSSDARESTSVLWQRVLVS
jgi:hypothetical protein